MVTFSAATLTVAPLVTVRLFIEVTNAEALATTESDARVATGGGITGEGAGDGSGAGAGEGPGAGEGEGAGTDSGTKLEATNSPVGYPSTCHPCTCSIPTVIPTVRVGSGSAGGTPVIITSTRSEDPLVLINSPYKALYSSFNIYIGLPAASPVAKPLTVILKDVVLIHSKEVSVMGIFYTIHIENNFNKIKILIK
jgi:hypothetical protein